MLRAHALTLPDLSVPTPALAADETPDLPAPRPVQAGGSDRRPPDDSKPTGQVIHFPRERVRPSPADPAPGPAAGEPLWPAWMAHVLTRYRPPEDGGRGPVGVMI